MNTHFLRRPGLVLLAGLGVLALAGCGSVAAGSGSSGGSGSGSAAPVSAGRSATPASSAPARSAPMRATLCANTKYVTRLVVVRNRSFSTIQVLHFPFPGQVTVTSAARARAVAAAICGLPVMPGGAVNCPNEVPGTSYRLAFGLAGKPLPMVTVQATGCEAVTGAGPARQAATSPGFWRTLGDAIGLFGAGPPVFSGTGPAPSQCRTANFREVMMRGCPVQAHPPATPRPVT
jgi:hypothetical protein